MKEERGVDIHNLTLASVLFLLTYPLFHVHYLFLVFLPIHGKENSKMTVIIFLAKQGLQ